MNGYWTAVPELGVLSMAEPEKVLLDHWHLTDGEWTTQRLEEMRYQYVDQVTKSRLNEYAARFQSPRLDRAVRRWLWLAAGLGLFRF